MAKPKTLLVVDDDPKVIMFFKEFFKREGYDALLTVDSEKAVKLAHDVQPDLLIIDLQMPRIDGFGVLSRVREKTPGIPTIVVTAYSEQFKDRIEVAKVQAVLRKPVRFDELEHWILKLLEVTKEEIQEKIPLGGRPAIEILVVDDETDISEYLRDCLNAYGFRTDAAYSGEEGLEKARAKRYDVIFTDVSMGSMSGIEMVRRIRGECPEQPGVIAVVSANVISEVKEKLSGLNVDTFIPKPMSLEETIRWLESQMPQLVAKRSAKEAKKEAGA